MSEQQCPACFHTNFDNPPLDDLEAACSCDCHEQQEDEYYGEEDEGL